MVQLSKKNAVASAVIVGAALVNGAAIPSQHGNAVLEVDASVLSLPNSLPQRTFALPDASHGKRMWRGRLGRRGPWRNDNHGNDNLVKEPVEEDLINLDLSNGPHRHHGSLVNIETVPDVKPRRHDDIVVIKPDYHRYGDNVHIHEHSHQKKSHGHDVIIADGYRHHGGYYYDDDRHGHYHGHDRYHGHYYGDRVEVYDKRRHDDDVVILDGGRHGHSYHDDEHDHIHEHIHSHGGNVKIVDKRRHDDNVVIVEDDDRHGHHGHHGHHHDNVHEHVHEHTHMKKHHGHDSTTIIQGDRHHGTTIVKGGRYRDTTIVSSGRHGQTTVVDGGRHKDVTVVERDVVDIHPGRHHHDEGVVIVKGGRHHRNPVTVVGRSDSDSTVSADGQGSEVKVDDDKEPQVQFDKRHFTKVLVVGDRHPWRDTGVYYSDRHDHHGRPIYFGTGGHDHVRLVDGPLVDTGHYGHRYGGWYKRSHSDDRHGRDRHDRHKSDKHDKHCRHGKCDSTPDAPELDVPAEKRSHGDDDRHSHHGHGHEKDGYNRHEEVTIVIKRDSSAEMGGAPGYIDVTSPVANSTTAQRIASLVLSTTNGTEQNSSFILNASNNIRTQVYLVPTNTTSTPSTPAKEGTLKVNLKLPIFVAQSASVEPYCATFDPAPTTPGPLFVTKCMEEGSDLHSSQIFSYDPSTGIIHPDWKPTPEATSILASVPDSVDDTITATDSEDDVEPSAITSVKPSSTMAVSASSSKTSSPPSLVTSGPKSSTDSTGLDSKSNNVTLIFTPVNPTVSAAFMDEDDTASPETSEETDDSAVGTMDARDYGYPDYPYDGEAEYQRSSYGAPYDSYEPYEPYGRYPEEEIYEQGPNGWTAPYDWRWTKASDETAASAPPSGLA